MLNWIKKREEDTCVACGATAGVIIGGWIETAHWYEYLFIFTIAWILAYAVCHYTLKFLIKHTEQQPGGFKL